MQAMTQRLVLFALVSSFAAGCGGVVPDDTVPVSGKVLFRGKPLPGIRVLSHRQIRTSVKILPCGLTDKDGVFRLSTAYPDNGAPPGDYVVTFEYPVIKSDNSTHFLETEVDAWNGAYSDPQQS